MASEADDDVAPPVESAAASTGIAGGQQGAAGEQGAPSHHSLGNGSATGITKPKMGGVTICDGRRVAYTGGIPLADWSGLDPQFAAVGYEDPNQLRSEKKPHEGFNTRTKGFEQKFGPKSDLRSVSLKIQEHFNSHGMGSAGPIVLSSVCCCTYRPILGLTLPSPSARSVDSPIRRRSLTPLPSR